MKRSRISLVAVTLATAIQFVSLIAPTKAWSDPFKPYHFDVRDIAYEMCSELLPVSEDRLGDMSMCNTAYEHCKTTLSDLAAQTADLRKFYKEGPYVYDAMSDDYLDFYNKFRNEHLGLDLASFDDGSGATVVASSSFELTYVDLKSAIQSCTMFPIDLCGNGIKDAGEMCDEGALNGKPGHCTDDCRLPVMRAFRAANFLQVININPAFPVAKKF